MADLGEYLRDCGTKRRASGIYDCVTIAADWAVAQGRPDPMARWRGQYQSEAEAGALITAAGGLVALFAIGMADAGIPEAHVPQPGDVAVVLLNGEQQGAVFSGKRWMLATDRGVIGASLDADQVVRIWRP